MILFISRYHNVFVRFLHSFFVQLPLDLWFRWFSLVIPRSATFVNYTALTDVQLAGCWSAAAAGLATQVFPTTASGGSHPPDPRALTVQPSNVTVIACPDEPIANLVKVNPAWASDKDPSGAILFDFGFGYEVVHAITMCWSRPRVYAAASQLPQVLVYEFQNIILSRLGYDVSQR